MDEQTLHAYDANAAAFAEDWHAQPAPTDLHAIVRRFFMAGPTADVGCGSGRDVAWLCANGYPAVGCDASERLLAEARARYPQHVFHAATLPDLQGLENASFANVLCETVIMHLPSSEIVPAVRRLIALLKPGGILYLSWRTTEGDDLRDGQGRLYAAFDPRPVLDALAGTTILLDEQVVSESSGRPIHRIVARNS